MMIQLFTIHKEMPVGHQFIEAEAPGGMRFAFPPYELSFQVVLGEFRLGRAVPALHYYITDG
jgi:hypothetical protein